MPGFRPGPPELPSAGRPELQGARAEWLRLPSIRQKIARCCRRRRKLGCSQYYLLRLAPGKSLARKP